MIKNENCPLIQGLTNISSSQSTKDCAVLVRDQKDSTSASGPRGRQAIDYREMAEEQGWVARMVHLFRNEDLGVQFEVSSGWYKQV